MIYEGPHSGLFQGEGFSILGQKWPFFLDFPLIMFDNGKIKTVMRWRLWIRNLKKSMNVLFAQGMSHLKSIAFAQGISLKGYGASIFPGIILTRTVLYVVDRLLNPLLMKIEYAILRWNDFDFGGITWMNG